MRPAALLLDLDGTLVDSEPIHRAGYAAWLAHRGWSVPDLGVFTGRRAPDVFTSEPGPWVGLDAHDLEREVLGFVPDADPAPVPGARDLVLAAHARGVPLAVVTSAGRPWTHRSLGSGLGLRDVFATLVTAEDVRSGKPDPAGYALACRRLAVEPPAAVAVEDSPAGLRAALDAGVGAAYGVSTTHAPEVLRAAGATATYPDLVALPAVLGLA